MEKLLASKKISTVFMDDLFGEKINMAYTGKLFQSNILIEFFGVSVEGDPFIYEETGVFASLKQNDIIHSYVLFVSGETLGPLPISRVISDAVEYIESCGQKSLIEDLKEISTSYELIDANHDSKEFYKNALYKHNKSIEIIENRIRNIN